eukprot:2488026-Pyramimonas_sp.AAC.1
MRGLDRSRCSLRGSRVRRWVKSVGSDVSYDRGDGRVPSRLSRGGLASGAKNAHAPSRLLLEKLFVCESAGEVTQVS